MLERPTRKRKPKSLFHFLTWKGGLRPDPELRVLFDTRNPFLPRLGKLIRESGMSLDQAREACIEEGFLQDHECREHEPTINDLLELIAAEARGNEQYRAHEALDAWEFSRPTALPTPLSKAECRAKQRKRQRNYVARSRAKLICVDVLIIDPRVIGWLVESHLLAPAEANNKPAIGTAISQMLHEAAKAS
jgi:hypothetical protein